MAIYEGFTPCEINHLDAQAFQCSQIFDNDLRRCFPDRDIFRFNWNVAINASRIALVG